MSIVNKVEDEVKDVVGEVKDTVVSSKNRKGKIVLGVGVLIVVFVLLVVFKGC
jgi:hypothetical protein